MDQSILFTALSMRVARHFLRAPMVWFGFKREANRKAILLVGPTSKDEKTPSKGRPKGKRVGRAIHFGSEEKTSRTPQRKLTPSNGLAFLGDATSKPAKKGVPSQSKVQIVVKTVDPENPQAGRARASLRLSIRHAFLLQHAFPELAPLFAVLLFWGPFVFHSPGEKDNLFAGVLLPA